MPVSPLYKSPNAKYKIAMSSAFDLDNGAGTTVDEAILCHSKAIVIYSAYKLYSDATSGTVAAGTTQIGTSVGGAEIVAATAYGNAKAVGTKETMTLVTAEVAAGTPVLVRHTGVASTQAGKCFTVIEYAVKDD